MAERNYVTPPDTRFISLDSGGMNTKTLKEITTTVDEFNKSRPGGHEDRKERIMAKITEVKILDKYTVIYDSGAVRFYDPDKLPKTVVKWLETQPAREPAQEPVQILCSEPVQGPEKAVSEQNPYKTSTGSVNAISDRPNALTVALWSLYFAAGVILYMGWWAAQVCVGAAVVADRIRTVTAPAVKQTVRRGAGQIACLWRWRAALLAEIP